MTTRHITVVGGGLGGLVAAITAAEAGAEVTLHEGHAELGGRARSTEAPYIANEGPHVIYADSPHWPWLKRRGLAPAGIMGPAAISRIRFRVGGELHQIPPGGILRAAAQRRLTAPDDLDFATWAGRRFGQDTARDISRMMGVALFDADIGRLAASFVWERFLRVTRPSWPAPRYVTGGWRTMVTRMADRARRLGVVIHTGSRVTALPEPPVIVATALPAARTLLGDSDLHTPSGHTVLVDLGLRRDPRDAFIVFDLEQAGFLERYTQIDTSLAPAGESLVQAQLPLRAGESKAEGATRMEPMLDLALPDWRRRETWRRTALASGRTGALDLPGTSWRDRPAIDRGDGVFLVGDQVAAPGLLGEVAMASARTAAAGALAELGIASPAKAPA